MAKDAASAALLKPHASTGGRNDFPLDQKHVHTMKSGQITPVKALHFLPNDFFKIQAHDFSITFPMNTAAFLRGRKETVFYSVYYNAVWSLYNQYIATRQDSKTSAFGYAPKLVEPRMRFFDLYAICLNQLARYLYREYLLPVFFENYADELVFDNVAELRSFWDTRKLMEMSNGTARTIWDFTDSIPNSDLRIGQTFMSSDLIDHRFVLVMPNVRFLNNKFFADFEQDIVGHQRVYNWVRKLDMLGFGNLYPLFDQAEKSVADYVSVSSSYESCLNHYTKVVSAIATAIVAMSFSGDERTIPKMTNLYAICAYNSVFYHFFRNSYYDNDYYVNDYSLDFVSSIQRDRSDLNQVFMSDFSPRFLDIEYHQWKKDLFTALLPDTQFGAVSSISIDNVLISGTGSFEGSTGNDSGRWRLVGFSSLPSEVSIISQPTNDLAVQGYDSLSHDHSVSGSVSISSSASIPNAFDVIQLKRAEMLQQYRQTLMRAGNKTSDVFRAIYGKAPSSEHEDDVIPRFLETFGEDIFVDPVIATASTGQGENGNLGDIAARGKFKGDSQSFKFNAGGNYGVILCLSYVVPEAEYNSFMIDKHNLELSPEAHFLPAYENWGLEPVYSDELNFMVDARNVAVLGYAPRYYHKKQSFDMVHGALCSSPFLGLHLPFTSLQIQTLFNPTGNQDFDASYYGEFNHWVAPRSELQNRLTTRVRDFYINPSVLDNVFVQAAGSSQAQDQFICNVYFEIQSVRDMSKVGLINFV